jgi:hypothetical protein
MINPDFPLDPSFPRRRESSKKNSARSGQSPEVDLLRRSFSMNWIPACAGMTDFRSNGKSRINDSNVPLSKICVEVAKFSGSTTFSLLALLAMRETRYRHLA